MEPFKRRGHHETYEDFKSPTGATESIVFFGGRDYLSLFCKLTAKAKAIGPSSTQGAEPTRRAARFGDLGIHSRTGYPSHLFQLRQKPWNFASPSDTLSDRHKIIEPPRRLPQTLRRSCGAPHRTSCPPPAGSRPEAEKVPAIASDVRWNKWKGQAERMRAAVWIACGLAIEDARAASLRRFADCGSANCQSRTFRRQKKIVRGASISLRGVRQQKIRRFARGCGQMTAGSPGSGR